MKTFPKRTQTTKNHRMSKELQDQCDEKVAKLVREYGMQNILLSMIMYIDRFVEKEEHEYKLVENLSKTREEYMSRYEGVLE